MEEELLISLSVIAAPFIGLGATYLLSKWYIENYYKAPLEAIPSLKILSQALLGFNPLLIAGIATVAPLVFEWAKREGWIK